MSIEKILEHYKNELLLKEGLNHEIFIKKYVICTGI